MKLLMHICCANCSLYPVKTLSEKGVSVTGLWFNPNIHPYAEYKNRLDAVKNFELLLKNPPSPPFAKGEMGGLLDIQIHYIDYYGIKEFIQRTGNGDENRCNACYEMRLDKTAQKAREIGADGFTTSLLISPYQKFDVIINIGREMEKRHSVQFYFEDFRPGWKQGVELSKELGLYRQKYCGCIYSEMERHLERVKREEVR
jgi:predicted adenine nucleotide alpha hydrolase (AANH) superfamily ATPase